MDLEIIARGRLPAMHSTQGRPPPEWVVVKPLGAVTGLLQVGGRADGRAGPLAEWDALRCAGPGFTAGASERAGQGRRARGTQRKLRSFL